MLSVPKILEMRDITYKIVFDIQIHDSAVKIRISEYFLKETYEVYSHLLSGGHTVSRGGRTVSNGGDTVSTRGCTIFHR